MNPPKHLTLRSSKPHTAACGSRSRYVFPAIHRDDFPVCPRCEAVISDRFRKEMRKWLAAHRAWLDGLRS